MAEPCPKVDWNPTSIILIFPLQNEKEETLTTSVWIGIVSQIWGTA